MLRLPKTLRIDGGGEADDLEALFRAIDLDDSASISKACLVVVRTNSPFFVGFGLLRLTPPNVRARALLPARGEVMSRNCLLPRGGAT